MGYGTIIVSNLPIKDFKFWGIKKSWSIHEAALLLEGSEPRNNSRTVVASGHSFHMRTYELLESHKYDLSSEVKRGDLDPHKVLDWAKKNEISYPPELEVAVNAFHGASVDWKVKYEIAEKEIAKLKEKIIELEALQQPVTTRELLTYQKILIALAVEYASYNNISPPSDMARRIETQSKVLGASVSDESIRSKLAESAKLVSEKTKDGWRKLLKF